MVHQVGVVEALVPVVVGPSAPEAFAVAVVDPAGQGRWGFVPAPASEPERSVHALLEDAAVDTDVAAGQAAFLVLGEAR